MPWILYPLFLYLGVDSPYIFYKFIISATQHKTNFSIKLTIFMTRSFYLFTCIFEGYRMFAFYIVYVAVHCIGNSTVFAKLHTLLTNVQNDDFSEIDTICQYFNRFRIISKHSEIQHMNFTCFGYFTTICVGILCNFVTIKMYHSFNVMFYLVFATLSVLVLVALPNLTQLSIDSNQSSELVIEKLKEKWLRTYETSAGGGRNGGGGHKAKILKKRIKSLFTFKISLGMKSLTFTDITMGTKSVIFSSIIDFSISALLSIPVE